MSITNKLKRQPLKLIVSYVLNTAITVIVYNEFGYVAQDLSIVLIVGTLLCSFWIILLINFSKRIEGISFPYTLSIKVIKNTNYTLILFWSMSVIGYLIIKISNLTVAPVLTIIGFVTTINSIAYFFLNRSIFKLTSSGGIYQSGKNVPLELDEELTNPANGAPMVDNIDVLGNPYGTNKQD